MPNFTSFISEHTAEYILIPQIVHELEKDFDKVIPLYFWATREGGIMARASLRPFQYKVIALYARRPKIDLVGAEENLIRINDLLFERAKTFGARGIPVIAGIPLLSDLNSLRLNSKCLWIHLADTGYQQDIKIDIHNPLIENNHFSLINPGEFKPLVNEKCNPIPGEEVIDIMRSAKNGFNSQHWSGLFNEQYKPVYILIGVD